MKTATILSNIRYLATNKKKDNPEKKKKPRKKTQKERKKERNSEKRANQMEHIYYLPVIFKTKDIKAWRL